MKGENPSAANEYGFSSIRPAVKGRPPKGKMSTETSEPPLTEEIEPAESILQGETTPAPTVEQRRFSAPMADWDPIR